MAIHICIQCKSCIQACSLSRTPLNASMPTRKWMLYAPYIYHECMLHERYMVDRYIDSYDMHDLMNMLIENIESVLVIKGTIMPSTFLLI